MALRYEEQGTPSPLHSSRDCSKENRAEQGAGDWRKSGLLGVAAIEKFLSAGSATVSVSRPLVATVTPGCQQTANKTSDISPAALMIFKAVSRFSI
jgi:hypothetical protein